MSYVLTEEQTLLRDSARVFMAENAPVAQLRRLRDTHDADGFSRPLWQRFAEMGFTGILVPEQHGGLGLGFVEAGLVMQEIGRNLTASPFLASSLVAATAIRHGASAAQQATWLPPLASGEKIAALAVDEFPKLPRIDATAAKTASGWRLSGSKTFVVDGHVADWLIVAARADTTPPGSDLALFVVPRTATGISTERTAMVDAHNAARFRFDNVALEPSARLEGTADGATALEAALDAGRVAAASEMLGLADEVFARTLAHLKDRKQFERRIGEFQALQHRAATLYCDIELARATVANACTRLDGATPDAWTAVAIAKARAGTTVTRAVQEAVQMHGGMGMTDELEIGLFMKRARVLQELFGDASFHANRLATSRGY